MTARGWLVAAVLMSVGHAAWAQTATSVWARATPANARTAAVYLALTAGSPDRLLGASTPVAADASLHETRMSGNVMQMRAVGPLPLTAGQKVVLAPGGLHLMLTGLKAPLHPGEHFPLTLHFEKAGDVTATVDVRKIGAPAPAEAMPGMDMNGN